MNILILQFLGDTFNALFAIMEEMAEEVGDLVFEALVSTLLSLSNICPVYLSITCHFYVGFHNWTTCC